MDETTLLAKLPLPSSEPAPTAPSRYEDEPEPRRYRTVFISDVHLGTKGCKAEFLLDFLKHSDCETLFLVGDIVDGWRLRKNWYWPQAHNDVVQKLLRKARKGTKIYYVPGNHDEMFRDYCGVHFGGVEVVEDHVYETPEGKRYLIIHGDRFDGIVRYHRWIALLGDWAYNAALRANTWINLLRRRLGFGYWSLSAYLKLKVKNAVGFINDFETALADEARKRGVDGVVCGHIHHAEIRDIGGVLYCNDGDWVESCTALVEHLDGRLEVVRWAEERAFSMLPAPRAAAKAAA